MSLGLREAVAKLSAGAAALCGFGWDRTICLEGGTLMQPGPQDCLGVLTEGQPAFRKVGHPVEQGRNHSLFFFYDLALDVIYHYLCHILLVMQMDCGTT